MCLELTTTCLFKSLPKVTKFEKFLLNSFSDANLRISKSNVVLKDFFIASKSFLWTIPGVMPITLASVITVNRNVLVTKIRSFYF